MSAAHPTPKDQEVSRLLEIVLELAADDTAPIVGMPPLNTIVNVLGVVVDAQDDADVIKSALVGTLAWITRHHWPEVSSEIRAVTGEVLQ